MSETKAFRDGLFKRKDHKYHCTDSSGEEFDNVHATSLYINGKYIQFSEVYNDGEKSVPTISIYGVTADEALEIIDWVMSK